MSKKIPLSNARRDLIREFGGKHIKSTIDRSKEQKQLAILLTLPDCRFGVSDAHH